MSRLKLALTRSPRLYATARRTLTIGRYLARRPHESDFAGFRHFRDREGIFLDLGANTGQSALSFRIFDRDRQILSLEPLPQHERDLKLVGRVIKGFGYVICAAGEQPGRQTLRVPVYNGLELTGEATLSEQAAGESAWATDQLGAGSAGQFQTKEVQVEVRKVDDMNLSPAIVKMDVEGFEVAALKGMDETLRGQRPVLMIECSGSHAAVREHLELLGYVALAYDVSADSFAELDSQRVLNAYFVHRESADLPLG